MMFELSPLVAGGAANNASTVYVFCEDVPRTVMQAWHCCWAGLLARAIEVVRRMTWAAATARLPPIQQQQQQ